MGAIQKTGNGQVIREPKRPADVLANLLANLKPEMAKALPKHISADRMVRIATTALRSTPKLAECSQVSFLGCVLSAAQLGLEVNTPLGQAYLIPRKGECTLQVGYQGYLELARRSGEVNAIYAEAVYPGDKFDYTLGLDKTLVHVPSQEDERESKPITHVYAVCKLKSGEALFVVLTRGQVERYKQRGAGGPAWTTDYEAMAKKTAIRRLFTWIPKSAEIASAIALDEAPEIGRPQVVTFDASVTAALEAQGISVQHDSETGELPLDAEGTEVATYLAGDE